MRDIIFIEKTGGREYAIILAKTQRYRYLKDDKIFTWENLNHIK